MPEFSKVKDFPGAADDLRSLPLFQWGKFLFATIGNPPEGSVLFSDMMQRMSWLPLDDFHFRADLSNDFEVNANWALYCENYLEGFHIPFVHSGLNEVLDYGSYTTELFSFSSLQLGLANEGELAFDLPEESLDFGKRVAGYYFWIFPNMMFNFYPWGLSINIVKPQSKDRTVVTFLTYMWDESKFDQGAGADLLRVEQEDEEVVESVQKGVRSRFYQHGRYAPEREQGTHHFHQLLANRLGQ
jgi:choline monooxygenase